MIPTSKQLAHLPFEPSLTITTADGTTYNVAASGLSLGDTELTDSCGRSEVPLGVAVGKTLRVGLLNDNGQWNGVDLWGADVTLTLDYGGGEVITWRHWTITEPPTGDGAFITCTALDGMWRTDKPYSTSLSYPTTVGAVWREACQACGLTSDTASSTAFDFSVASPIQEGCSYRQVIAWIAALAGGTARINQEGNIILHHWTLPTASTPTAQRHTLDDWISLVPALKSVQVTGVSAAIAADDGSEDQIVTVGDEGYILQLDRNPLITTTNAQPILTLILGYIGGVDIRPYTGEYFYLPTVEAGDACAVRLVNGTTVFSIVTDVTWRLGGKTALSCRVDVPIASGRQYYDPATRAIVEARRLVTRERTAREQAILTLQDAIAQSSGMYQTAQQQQDGSTIYYLHDRPTLAGSTNIIKLTSEAIGLSTDGGQSYPYGFTLTGDMITRVLSATGINADWINTGALTVRSETGELLLQADVGAHSVYIAGINVSGGVVTVGVDGGDYQIKVGGDGMSIQRRDQEVAAFGSQTAILPERSIVPNNGGLQVGYYLISPGDDGAIDVVPGYDFGPAYAEPSAAARRYYGNPTIIRSATSITRGVAQTGAGGKVTSFVESDTGDYWQVTTKIKANPEASGVSRITVRLIEYCKGALQFGIDYMDTYPGTVTTPVIDATTGESGEITLYVRCLEREAHVVDVLIGDASECYDVYRFVRSTIPPATTLAGKPDDEAAMVSVNLAEIDNVLQVVTHFAPMHLRAMVSDQLYVMNDKLSRIQGLALAMYSAIYPVGCQVTHVSGSATPVDRYTPAADPICAGENILGAEIKWSLVSTKKVTADDGSTIYLHTYTRTA